MTYISRVYTPHARSAPLLGRGCAVEGGDDAAAAPSIELLLRFSGEHAACWFGVAADALRRTDDDFYASVRALAAESVDALVASLIATSGFESRPAAAPRSSACL